MKLENQVCSLELAMRLKELEVKQESAFVWYTNADNGHLLYLGEDGMRPMEAKTYSAFSVAELGEMLPSAVFKNQQGENYFLEAYKQYRTGKIYDADWTVWYRRDDFKLHIESKTEVDARAKMLIYLLENKLINPN